MTNQEDNGSFPLWGVYFHVASACNLSCTYCYASPVSKPRSDDLTKADYDRIWKDISVLKPHQVVFTGGEPLLRPDILDIVRGLREADEEHAIRRCLNTNGTLVTPGLAQKMRGLLDHVRVSLDGPPEINDRFRGPGSYRAALAALDILSDAGFTPRATITVSRLNLPYVRELIDFLLARGVKDIKTNVLRALGRGKDCAETVLTPQEMEEITEETLKKVHPDGILKKETWRTTCNVGRFIDIAPDGTVSPCYVLRQYQEFRCGNLKEQSLQAICRQDKLMGQLAYLNFIQLVRADWGVVDLLDPYACLGEIYGRHCGKPVWKKIISQMNI